MAKIDHTYHNLLEKILQEGYDYKDESRDVMCKQISSYEFRHNIRLNGFPAITTKKLYWKGVVGELIWFLRGDTNIKYLVNNNIHIWNKDALNWAKNYGGAPENFDIESFLESVQKEHHNGYYQFGELGKVYGNQWRYFTKQTGNLNENPWVDQISNLIQNLKDKPMSRRHIVTAWNPAELDQMALPPCHFMFQILPRPLSLIERSKLSNFELGITITDDMCDKQNISKYMFDLKFSMRSNDVFLGLPFNIASYGLLMEIIGKMTNMIPNELIGDLSNVHIYHPHIEAVKTQLKNKVDKYWRPIKLKNLVEYNTVDDVTNDVIDLMEIKHFQLEDYESYPAIPAEMLVFK